MNPQALKTAVSLALATTLGSAPSIAQESSSTTARLMEEIVVSARGIEEGLQDAPIAVSAFTGNKDSLNIQLVQLVKLMDGGQQVKMSKRAGTFVTLSDVLDAVGRDILRFIMLTRRADQTMDFDYVEVTTQSRENPVFYVQYAHARASSVLRQDEVAQINMADADLGLLTDSNEMALIRQLASFPRQVEAAGQAFEPHRIAFYLMDLAASFHGLWNKGRDDASLRFITDDPKLTAARLKLVDATAVVIRNGFAILGVEAIKEM